MLDTPDIVDFAEDALRSRLGPAIPRCFLAGGAYKTLLHGRAPRDFDLWAETEADRARLIERLRARGEELDPAPGARRFRSEGALVEVSHQVETMEARLDRFDLGLSRVAVAFRGRARVPFVHALARESVRRREILLVALARPGLALATLVRVRRYASDLGYGVPADVDAHLWAVHEGLPKAERRAQIDALRFHYGAATHGVDADAERRLAQGE